MGGAGVAGRAAPLVAGAGVWLVSGRTSEALAGQAGRLAGWAAARPDLDAGDVGWSLAVSRSVFEHRAVVTGAGREELAAGLAAVAAGEPGAGVAAGSVPPGGAGRVVFVFSGHGAQWAGMGRELAGCCPVFAARLAECSAALAPFTGWRVEDVLAGAAGGVPGLEQELALRQGAPDLEREDVLQPVLWAVSVALAAVWQAAGVTPAAVAGHSQGEVAAATVAGILSLEDAAAVVVAGRSRVVMSLAGRGGMLSLAEPAAAGCGERIAPFGGGVVVRWSTARRPPWLSGEPEAWRSLAADCRAGRGAHPPRCRSATPPTARRPEQVREELAGCAGRDHPPPGDRADDLRGDRGAGRRQRAGRRCLVCGAALAGGLRAGRAYRLPLGMGTRCSLRSPPHPVAGHPRSSRP